MQVDTDRAAIDLTGTQLHQRMGDVKPAARPYRTQAIVSQADTVCCHAPCSQQHQLQHAVCSHCQNNGGQCQFNQGHSPLQSTTKRQCFHCLRFHHLPQQFARSLMPYLLGIEPERSVQQSLFQQRSRTY